MAAFRVVVVDVFAERPLAGNQLAVVRGCGGLGSDTMQMIAREMNFSETTFVVAESEDSAQVRIFTPVHELPFAGHPTLGTAWVLGRERGFYALDLPIGRVRVTFEEGGIAWLQAPPVRLGETLPAKTAATLLSLDDHEIDATYPCRIAAVGPRFVLAGVATVAALRRAKVNTEAHAKLAADGFLAQPRSSHTHSEFGSTPSRPSGPRLVECADAPWTRRGPLGVFPFTEEAYSTDADYAARMFFDAAGWREDPATGSANAAFAAYLRAQGMGGEIIVEQGFEVARPSRLYLDLGTHIRVGGKVRPVLRGTLDV